MSAATVFILGTAAGAILATLCIVWVINKAFR